MLRVLRRVNDRRRHVNGEYGWLFYPYTGDEMVVIDCETTGVDLRTAEPVSIGAVRVRGDRVLSSESLNLWLKRPASLTGDSIRVHGLRGIDLDDGMEIKEALVKLLNFIGNRPLLGWRLDFDLAIINRQLRPHFGFDLPNSTMDVAQLHYRRQRRSAHGPEPVSMRFEAVAQSLGVPVMGRNTALGDAITTALIYLQLERAQERRKA